MEIEKALGVFKELIEEEKNYNIQKLLNNLLGYINSGASSDVEAVLIEIEKYSKESILNNYAYSKLKLLEKINVNSFFGQELFLRIKSILNKEVYKVKDNLSQLITKRDDFIKTVTANIQNLEKLDFESYYDSINDFEVGLIIPENEADLNKVQNYLKDWHFILKHVAELCDKNHKEPKIYSVSTNSIGIFTIENVALVFGVLKIVEKVVKIYADVQKLKKIKKELEVLDLKKNIKELDVKAKEIVTKETSKIVSEIIAEHKKNIKEGREEELKTAMKKVVEKIIHMQDNGVIIETTPPKEEEPEILSEEETTDNKQKRDSAKKEYESFLDKTKKVSEVASNISSTFKSITSGSREILQLAQYLDSEKNEKEEVSTDE